jgi:hypothetical protein
MNEQDIAKYIYFVGSAILTIVALIGNTWTCYIFTREKFRKVSMFFYLAIGNVVNLLLMLTIWPDSLAKSLFKFDSLLFSCKFFSFITFFLSDLGPWVIALGSLDRLLSVKYSRRFQFRNKFKYQLFIVLIITTFITIVNLPLLIYLEIQIQNSTTLICNYKSNFEYLVNYMGIKTNIVSLLLPFLLMLISTILIAHHLIKNKKKLDSSRTKFKKEIRYVRVVVSVDLFYFVTNAPALVKAIIFRALNITYSNIWMTLTLNLLLAFYLSADFFVYFWCNKLFRDYVYFLIRCCCFMRKK